MLFQKDEALILGYLLSSVFTVKKEPGFIGSYGNDYPWSKGDNAEDASGGYPRGRNGKPPLKTLNGDLCGSGGLQNAGGWGLRTGTFGFGGYGVYTSSGGGGGLFGGGSSYAYSGGGGGSSYVWDGIQPVEGYMNIQEYMLEQGFPNFDPLSVCAINDPLIPLLQNEFCYNARFGAGSVKITHDTTLTFEFERYIQLYEVPEDGVYIIECWGGQGGSSVGGLDTSDPYVGGCGGYSKAAFNLKKGMVLHITTGEYGGSIRSPQRPFGGGGGAGSQGYAGGGASYVQLEPNNMRSCLIIAGGGGGSSPARIGLDSDPDGGKDPPTPPTGSNDDPEDEDSFSTGKQMFVISDLSIAYVDLTYRCSFDIEDTKFIRVTLYVDGIKRGVIERPAIAGGGFDTWTFDNFDTWLPPNTTPYWATLEAVIETNLEQIVVPVNGLVIRVETKTRPNDKYPVLKNIFGYFQDTIRAASYLMFSMKENKNLLEELYRVRSSLSSSSFMSVFIKIVKLLLHNGYSKVQAGSYMGIELSGSEPHPPSSLYDLYYITQNVGAGSYSAFFINKIGKTEIDTVAEIKASSFMEVKIKTVPTLKIETVSKIDVTSNIEME